MLTPEFELYGTSTCQYTAQMREDLEWRRVKFIEYDVESDTEALDRMISLCKGNRTVPVLVERGRVIQVGVEGRGCYVSH